MDVVDRDSVTCSFTPNYSSVQSIGEHKGRIREID